MRFIFIAMGVFMAISHTFSQKDSLRNHYINPFHEYSFVGPVIKQKTMSLEAKGNVNPGQKIVYKPNNSYSLGAGFHLLDLNVEATFSVPVNEKSVPRFGESTSSDFQINMVGERWLASGYFQRYSGFYYGPPEQVLTSTDPYPQRPDLEARNNGITVTYIFNHNKFSMRAAYLFTERQNRSKGSFLLNVIFTQFGLSSDSALVPVYYQPTVGIGSHLEDLTFATLGVAPGYSYNVVYRKFFINATFMAGPAHYWTRAAFQGSSPQHDFEINVFSGYRVALGYNGDNLFSGLSVTSQGRKVSVQEVDFKTAIGTVRFIAGYRFREKGIFRKGLLDFVPFLKRKP